MKESLDFLSKPNADPQRLVRAKELKEFSYPERFWRKRFLPQIASNIYMRIHSLIVSLITVACGVLPGCAAGNGSGDSVAIVGSPQRGQAVIKQFRCGSCHMVPGIPNADGLVGPPLNQIASRTFIAGEFQNNPENLIHWIQAPTSMKPKTLMPDLGLTEQQATDAAAYLETLRSQSLEFNPCKSVQIRSFKLAQICD